MRIFGLGVQELLVILLICLLVFGAAKLPEIGRALGSAIRELKKASRELSSAMRIDLDLDEDQDTSCQNEDAVEKG